MMQQIKEFLNKTGVKYWEKVFPVSPTNSSSTLPAIAQSSNQGTPQITPVFGSPIGTPRGTLGDIHGAWPLIMNSSKIDRSRREEFVEYLDEMGMTHAEDLEVHANDVGIMKKIKEFLNKTGLLDWKNVFSPNTNTCGGGGCPLPAQ